MPQLDTADTTAGLFTHKFTTHLAHETIGSGALVVAEQDITVVVRHQVLELGRVPTYWALQGPGGAAGVLGEIGNGLLEDQWVEVALPTTAQASTGAAAVCRRKAEGQHQEQDCQQSCDLARATLRIRNVALDLFRRWRSVTIRLAFGARAGAVAFGWVEGEAGHAAGGTGPGHTAV